MTIRTLTCSLPTECTWVQVVALDGDRLAGTCELTAAELDCPTLCSLFVAKRHRHNGVGAALVRAAVGWARRNGKAAVMMAVVKANPAAERLYRGLGFQVIDTDEKYRWLSLPLKSETPTAGAAGRRLQWQQT